MNRNFDFLQVLAVVFGALVAVVLGDAFSVRGCSLGVGGFSCPGSSMRSGQRFGAVVVDRGFLAVGGSSDGDNRPSQGNTDLRKSTTTLVGTIVGLPNKALYKRTPVSFTKAQVNALIQHMKHEINRSSTLTKAKTLSNARIARASNQPTPYLCFIS